MLKNKKANKYLIINILITTLSIVLGSFNKVEDIANDFEKNLMIISWMLNSLFLWNIYSIYKIRKDIFDYNIIFQFFIFLFCNGQILLYSLGVPIKQLSILRIASHLEIIKEVVFLYFSLLFFQTGVLVGIKKQENNCEGIEKYNNKRLSESIKILAYVLLGVSIAPYVYILIPKIKISIVMGYKGLYLTQNSINGIVGYSAKLFIPSLIMLLYSYKDRKKNLYIGFSILIILSLINLIIGARGDSLSIIVILIIFYNKYISRIKGIKLLKIFIIVLVVLIIIPTIANFRSKENKSIDIFVNSIEETLTDNESNFIIKTISELGSTMNAFILTDEVIPSVENYKYGESYLASILMLIPSKAMGGYSFAEKAALDIWLQKIHKMNYGPGYSIFAETYYNFGFYGGIIFATIIGFTFSKILNMNSKNKINNELFQLLSLVFLYNSLIVARLPFHNTTRNIVYMYFIPYVIIKSIYNKREEQV